MTATSPYDELTPESIKASMLSDLTAKGVDVSIREGSYANTLVSVAAYQLFKMYQQFPSLLHMAFPDETSGEYIDKNAAQIGMVRAAGKKATVEIAFTGTEGTYIAAGTALYAPESGLQFLTTEEASVATAVTDEHGRTTWIDPDSPENIGVTRINKAMRHMVEGDYEAALKELEGQQENPAAFNYIGVCYMMKGDYDTAEKFLRKAEAPGDPYASVNLEHIGQAKRIEF